MRLFEYIGEFENIEIQHWFLLENENGDEGQDIGLLLAYDKKENLVNKSYAINNILVGLCYYNNKCMYHL